MRSRKVEKAIKDAECPIAEADNYADADPATISNINTTVFCPYINNRKHGHMHRQYPTGMPEPNNKYHWWQLKDFKNVQFCRLQKDPEENFEKCEKRFKECKFYKMKEAECPLNKEKAQEKQ